MRESQSVCDTNRHKTFGGLADMTLKISAYRGRYLSTLLPINEDAERPLHRRGLRMGPLSGGLWSGAEV